MRRRRRLLNKRRSVVLLIPLLVVILAVALLSAEVRLRPLIAQYGSYAAKRTATLCIHTAAQTVLSRRENLYQTLVQVRYGESGRVVAVETDTAQINLLKAQLNQEISEQLQKNTVAQITVPFGNVVGGSFFTGRGPYLHFDIHIGGTVIVTLQSRLQQAGVNQTQHSIYLVAQADLVAAAPNIRDHIAFSTEFLLVETVLLGEVPQVFASLEGNW